MCRDFKVLAAVSSFCFQLTHVIPNIDGFSYVREQTPVRHNFESIFMNHKDHDWYFGCHNFSRGTSQISGSSTVDEPSRIFVVRDNLIQLY